MATLADGVSMTWLMDDGIKPEAGLSLARMTVDPGITSEAHRHTNCTEAIHVLSGQIKQRSGDRWISLKSGETILIPVGAIHQTTNVGDDVAILMIAYSSGSRVYEIERGD
ncbi:MAG: cupin domain-containing protein [Geminicoccaceae bacterium]